MTEFEEIEGNFALDRDPTMYDVMMLNKAKLLETANSLLIFAFLLTVIPAVAFVWTVCARYIW